MTKKSSATRMGREFAKLDPERQLAFGWAYVADDGGVLVKDHSGDFVDETALPDLEDAVYTYVLESREGDEMHERVTGIAKLVESVFVTPEKLAAMGLTGDRTGWWTGYKVMDDRVWERVKSGEYAALSIRGTGVRED